MDLKGCDNLEKLPSYCMSECLEVLNLSYSYKLKEVSTEFPMASKLEEFDLKFCFNLRRIHDSIGSLDKLVTLELDSCYNLGKLPSYLKLKSLVYLSLIGCRKVEQLLEFDENMKCLREMNLEHTGIEELPSSIGYLSGLENLSLRGCENLITLPNTIYLLKSLKEIRLSRCSKLEMFPQLSSSLKFSQEISLCSKLSILDLEKCNISNADFLENLSNVYGTSLNKLNLSRNKYSCLPSLRRFTSLRFLELRNCKFLRNIAELPQCLEMVNANGCELLVLSPDYITDIIFGSKQVPLFFLPCISICS